jgi:hypothetical protein
MACQKLEDLKVLTMASSSTSLKQPQGEVWLRT